MISPGPGDPRTPQEPVNPIFVIAGVGFVALLLFGALFVAFLQNLHFNQAGAAPKEQPLEVAEQAFRSGDYGLALVIFSSLAGKNNAIAQYWLAHMTELGLGIRSDPTKAIALYKESALRDVTAAQLRLGEIYLHGDVVPPDFNQAKSYLERAAYHGDARAAMQLGQMYHLGQGMPADPIEAYAWLEVASLEGNMFARRARDALLADLREGNQQEAVARARDLLNQIKRETTPPSTPSPASQKLP